MSFVKKNNLPADLVLQAKAKFEKEERKLKTLKLKLKPFLIDERRTEKLNLFPQVLKELEKG